MRWLGVMACLLAVASARAGEVEREERLPVDGASLHLVTRGAHASAPVLLWLHGGPGGAETPLFRLYDAGLEQRFVVVYWDQRGAGRSYDPGADPKQLTIARHLADLDAVVDHLRASLGREKIALVGHSWGGALGLLYAQAHPEKVDALIGVGPVTAGLARQRAMRAFVESEARRRGDTGALAELEALGEPPYSAEQETVASRWVDAYGGAFHQRPSFAWALVRASAYGYAWPWEVPGFIRANDVTLAAMNAELVGLDLARSVPRVAVPVTFFLGRFDHQVEASLSAQYLEGLDAPAKRVVWFEDSAHNIPFEEPEKFCAAVVEALLGAPANEGKAERRPS